MKEVLNYLIPLTDQEASLMAFISLSWFITGIEYITFSSVFFLFRGTFHFPFLLPASFFVCLLVAISPLVTSSAFFVSPVIC